jgi:glucose/arabinose dehydrogenase
MRKLAAASVCVLLILLAWPTATRKDAIAQSALPALRVIEVTTGLTTPLAFVQDPTDPRVQFIVQQDGRIRVLRDGVLLPDDFLNLSSAITYGGENGLLGLAFAPDYGVSRRFFVNFSDPSGHTVIARFRRSAGNALRADAASRFDLLWPGGTRYIFQPYSNHNGGDLAFGSDGFLYIPLGDGGSGNDPEHRAQNPATLLGKMLRIDVNVADSDPEGYDVPAGNPFAGRAGYLPEIWAFGLRNPFRFSVDARERGGSGAILIGDVGQGAWEEIDHEPFGAGGRNYGWRNREGAHDNITSPPPAFLPLVDPIVEYGRTVGTTVIGGVVNRGTGLGPLFFGRYFYADFGSGRVFSVRLNRSSSGEATAADAIEHTADIGGPPGHISAFGIDASCRVYMTDWGAGRILRLDTATPIAAALCATPDPFLSLGGGTFFNGGWLPPGYPLPSSIPQPSSDPPSPGTPTPTTSTACTTTRPASDWVCVNGGWVPPGHPLAAGGSSTPTEPAPTSPAPGTCTSPRPGADWVCVNGGWVPPGHPLARGGG